MNQKVQNNFIFYLGILLCLSGAIIMVEGSIFRERTLGVSIILGIIGICLISRNSPWKTKKL